MSITPVKYYSGETISENIYSISMIHTCRRRGVARAHVPVTLFTSNLYPLFDSQDKTERCYHVDSLSGVLEYLRVRSGVLRLCNSIQDNTWVGKALATVEAIGRGRLVPSIWRL